MNIFVCYFSAKRLKPSAPEVEEDDSLGVGPLCSPAPKPPLGRVRAPQDGTSSSSEVSASKVSQQFISYKSFGKVYTVILSWPDM